MIIEKAKSWDVQITTIFKFLNFAAVYTQSEAYLSDGIDRKYTLYLSTRFSVHEHRFLSKFNYLDFINFKH